MERASQLPPPVQTPRPPLRPPDPGPSSHPGTGAPVPASHTCSHTCWPLWALTAWLPPGQGPSLTPALCLLERLAAVCGGERGCEGGRTVVCPCPPQSCLRPHSFPEGCIGAGSAPKARLDTKREVSHVCFIINKENTTHTTSPSSTTKQETKKKPRLVLGILSP